MTVWENAVAPSNTLVRSVIAPKLSKSTGWLKATAPLKAFVTFVTRGIVLLPLSGFFTGIALLYATAFSKRLSSVVTWAKLFQLLIERLNVAFSAKRPLISESLT